MRLPGLERQTQRLAGAEQMLLADHFVRRLRAQLLRERGTRINRVPRKQIGQCAPLPCMKVVIRNMGSVYLQTPATPKPGLRQAHSRIRIGSCGRRQNPGHFHCERFGVAAVCNCGL